MKKQFMLFIGIIIIIAIALFVLAGCKAKEPEKLPLENRDAITGLINITDANITMGSAQKCDINGIIYYVKGPFIYHINNRDDQIVYSPAGIYTKRIDLTFWAFEKYLKKNNSIYLDATKWITDKKLPNDNPIECVSTDTIPKNFADFYMKHEGFFNTNSITRSDISVNNNQSL
jgi:hypothetical protein